MSQDIFISTTWCEAWTSHEDVTGEGEQTFYHECVRESGHEGLHTCLGHSLRWSGGELACCNHTWDRP